MVLALPALYAPQYTLAKLIRATERMCEALPNTTADPDAAKADSAVRHRVAHVWGLFLQRAGVSGAALTSALGMVGTAFRERGPMTDAEVHELREFFAGQAPPSLHSVTTGRT